MLGSGCRGAGRAVLLWLTILAPLALADPAEAASPVEDALAGAIQAIDASPDWTASYRSLTYDAVSDTAVISDVRIGLERQPAFSITFDAIAVTGYDGRSGFSARSVKIGSGRLTSPVIGAAFTNLSLDGLAVPDFSGYAIDPTKPFSSVIGAYSLAATTVLARASLDRFGFTEQVAGETTNVTYDGIALEGMQHGRIAVMRTGAVTMTLPAPEGLFRFAVRHFEGRDYDLNAFLAVFDSSRYQNGVGDMQWRRVIGTATYQDVSLEAPGAVIRLGELDIDDFRFRQPPRSFAEFFDRALANPGSQELQQDSAELGMNMLASMGVGHFGLKDLDVASIGIDRFRIGEFYIDELSLDGLGAVGVRNVDVAIPGEAAGTVDDFSLGGVAFPSLDALLRAVHDEQAGQPSGDPMALVPHLGFIEAAGLDLTVAGQPAIRLQRARLDLGAYVGVIPTAVHLAIRGFDVPLEVIEAAMAAASSGEGATRFPTEIVRALGYDRLTMDYGFDLAWREADAAIDLSDLHLAISQMGRIGIDLGISGITRAMIANFDKPMPKPPELMFEGLKLTVSDDTLFNKVLAYVAERLNVKPEQLKATMLVTLPFQLIGIVPDATLRTQIMHAATAFIQAPGTIIVTVKPVGEVSLAMLSSIRDIKPADIGKYFTITVENQAATPQ